jgi:imidazolonepropionase-like amidohydrolase
VGRRLDDTPNPLLVPGYSIHLELQVLAEAGIPVIEVLRAATVGAAQFSGAAGGRGVVRDGAVADLLLLDDDPRDRLGTLEAPIGVMVGGRWFDREALERMLAEFGGDD